MRATPFKWGILGPGRIANTFAEAVSVVDGATLHAVASRDAGRAAAFAEKHGAATTFDSYEALVSDPAVDAVYIATPHPFHHDHAMLCLDAGRPVLCEKPLTVTGTEAKALVDASRANNVFLMEALWTRCLPVYGQIRRWLDEGRIGEVKLVRSTFGFKMPRDANDRLLNPHLGGGALLDLGVYNVAMSQWALAAKPASFVANAYLGETGVDELLLANLSYENGSFAQFSCGFVTETENSLTIHGTDGRIRVHPMFWSASKATLVTTGQELTVTMPFRKNGFEYQIEAAMRCIGDGSIECPDMSHADSIANMSLMDEIRGEIGLVYPFE